jgi:hypothetical protein
VPDNTAHQIWGALETQFLGHRQTRILYLETAFRQLAQGDLSVDEYCRQMKTMADTLRTLRASITDECLVLNLLRGLSPRFDRVTLILTRIKPFPTFAETKNDLLLEELRLSATATLAPATTLYSAPRTAPSASGGAPLHRTSVPRRLELFGSLLAPLWPRSWSQEWTQWHGGRPRHDRWFPVAICLQPVDWHHPHVAWAVWGCLAPPPLNRSSLLLHLRQRPRHLLSRSRGSFPFRGLRPSPCGGRGQMGGTRSLSSTPSPR